MGKKKPNITCLKDTNVIVINKMDHPSCVTSFNRTVNAFIKRGQKELVIDCRCEQNSIFPDACLPISALIQNYQRIYTESWKDMKMFVLCRVITQERL